MLLVTCTVNLSGICITTLIYVSDATGDVYGCLAFLRQARETLLSIMTDTRREFDAIPTFWRITAPRSNHGVTVDHSIKNPLKYRFIFHPNQRSLTILSSKIFHPTTKYPNFPSQSSPQPWLFPPNPLALSPDLRSFSRLIPTTMPER